MAWLALLPAALVLMGSRAAAAEPDAVAAEVSGAATSAAAESATAESTTAESAVADPAAAGSSPPLSVWLSARPRQPVRPMRIEPRNPAVSVRSAEVWEKRQEP